MAALAGTGVTHALVDIDGPEVPIMDGSARRFVQAILRAGLAPVPGAAARDPHPEAGPRGRGRRRRPSSRRRRALSIDFEIDFPDAAIGRQAKRAVDGERRLRARARRLPHLLPPRRTSRRCRRSGLALGGSLDNAVVVEGDRVLNPGGLRRAGRVRAPQDARRARRSRAGRRADPRRLPRRARRARRDQPAAPAALRDARAPGRWSRSTPRRQRQLPGAGVGAADLRRAG